MYPLPTEVAQVILSHAPDSYSLRSLVLCCRSFYYAFLALEKGIIHCVMVNEFERAVRPDVVAAIASRSIALADNKSVEAFLVQYSYSLISLPPGWSFCDSLQATKLKHDVDSLTLRFANTIAVNELSKSTRLSPVVLTRSESIRVERSLYRYETYCNLVRRMQLDPWEYYTNSAFLKRRHLFFDKFAPWENEQFVTMYEYLWSCVSKGKDPVFMK